jgi:hypothetical protein
MEQIETKLVETINKHHLNVNHKTIKEPKKTADILNLRANERKIVITMNETTRVNNIFKYQKENELNFQNFQNVYIDEGDELVCSKISDVSEEIFNCLDIDNEHHNRLADDLYHLQENEKPSIEYFNDDDIEYDNIYNDKNKICNIDDKMWEDDMCEESDKVTYQYWYVKDKNNNENKKYIIKKTFKGKKDYFRLKNLPSDNDTKSKVTTPKLQRQWEKIFESMKRKCYITASPRALINYENDKTALFYLLPEKNYHSYFMKNENLKEDNKFINIIDCQQWMTFGKGRKRQQKILDIHSMNDKQTKKSFLCNVFQDMFLKIKYDIINNKNVMLPYYSILFNGVENYKKKMDSLRTSIFESFKDICMEKQKQKKKEDDYNNDENFGIWIVNSTPNKKIDYILGSVKEYFEKLSKYGENNTEKPRIHILITDDLNKRGVVNRPEKGTGDGGHFAALYPKKGGNMNSHFENLYQRAGRSCNNSGGIFNLFCQDRRKNPEMFVYMDDYAALIIQILSQDVALCNYFFKNRDDLLKQSYDALEEEGYLKKLLNDLPNKDGYDKYWSELLTSNKKNKSLKDSRKSLENFHRQDNNTFKNKEIVTFDANNMSPEEVYELLSFLKKRTRTEQTGPGRERNDVSLGNLGFFDLSPKDIDDSKLDYYFPFKGTLRSFKPEKPDEFWRDKFLPEVYKILFNVDDYQNDYQNNDYKLQNLELFYKLEVIEEDSMKGDMKKLIELKSASEFNCTNTLIKNNNFAKDTKVVHCNIGKTNTKKTKFSRFNTDLINIFKYDPIMSQYPVVIEEVKRTTRSKVERKKPMNHNVYKTFNLEDFDIEVDESYEYIDVFDKDSERKYEVQFFFVDKRLNKIYANFSDEKKSICSLFIQMFLINNVENLIRFNTQPIEENQNEIIKELKSNDFSESFMDTVFKENKKEFTRSELEFLLTAVKGNTNTKELKKLRSWNRRKDKRSLWHYTTPKGNGNSLGVIFKHNRENGKYQLKIEENSWINTKNNNNRSKSSKLENNLENNEYREALNSLLFNDYGEEVSVDNFSITHIDLNNKCNGNRNTLNMFLKEQGSNFNMRCVNFLKKIEDKDKVEVKDKDKDNRVIYVIDEDFKKEIKEIQKKENVNLSDSIEELQTRPEKEGEYELLTENPIYIYFDDKHTKDILSGQEKKEKQTRTLAEYLKKNHDFFKNKNETVSYVYGDKATEKKHYDDSNCLKNLIKNRTGKRSTYKVGKIVTGENTKGKMSGKSKVVKWRKGWLATVRSNKYTKFAIDTTDDKRLYYRKTLQKNKKTEEDVLRDQLSSMFEDKDLKYVKALKNVLLDTDNNLINLDNFEMDKKTLREKIGNQLNWYLSKYDSEKGHKNYPQLFTTNASEHYVLNHKNIIIEVYENYKNKK